MGLGRLCLLAFHAAVEIVLDDGIQTAELVLGSAGAAAGDGNRNVRGARIVGLEVRPFAFEFIKLF